jgi:hypothetical protein
MELLQNQRRFRVIRQGIPFRAMRLFIKLHAHAQMQPPPMDGRMLLDFASLLAIVPELVTAPSPA